MTKIINDYAGRKLILSMWNLPEFQLWVTRINFSNCPIFAAKTNISGMKVEKLGQNKW